MYGELLVYHERLTTFISGCIESKKCIILIGGLTDGFNALPFTEALNAACIEHGCSLVQVILSSSYLNFGNSSLQKDCEELERLLVYLESERGYQSIILLGHSTGCQDIVWLFRHFCVPESVRAVILQGPVSDADYMHFSQPDLISKYSLLEIADDEMMPIKLFNAPITGYRFKSLCFYNGDDDMFSFGDPNKKSIVKDISAPCLIVMSEHDQYINRDPNLLLSEFEAPHSLLLNTDHYISTNIKEFIAQVFKFGNQYN